MSASTIAQSAPHTPGATPAPTASPRNARNSTQRGAACIRISGPRLAVSILVRSGPAPGRDPRSGTGGRLGRAGRAGPPVACGISPALAGRARVRAAPPGVVGTAVGASWPR